MPDKFYRQMFALGDLQHAGSFRTFQMRSGDDTIWAHLTKNRVGKLDDGKPDMRWNISISVAGQQRLPTWDEMKVVRKRLKPDVHFCIPMPPEKFWMNIGEVLHLQEVKDKNLVEQWEHEGREFQKDKKRGVKYGATLDDAIRARRK